MTPPNNPVDPKQATSILPNCSICGKIIDIPNHESFMGDEKELWHTKCHKVDPKGQLEAILNELMGIRGLTGHSLYCLYEDVAIGCTCDYEAEQYNKKEASIVSEKLNQVIQAARADTVNRIKTNEHYEKSKTCMDCAGILAVEAEANRLTALEKA